MVNKFGIFSVAALAALAVGAVETVDLNGLLDFRFERGKSLEEVAGDGGGRGATALPAFEANDKMTVPGCWNAYSHYFNQHGVRGERQDDRAGLLERLLALLQSARHGLLPAHVRARRGGGRRLPRGGRRGPPLALLGGRTRDRLQQAAVEQVRVPHGAARGRTPRARGRRRLRGGQQEGEALLGLLRLLPLRRLPPRRAARRAGEARGAAPRGGAHARLQDRSRGARGAVRWKGCAAGLHGVRRVRRRRAARGRLREPARDAERARLQALEPRRAEPHPRGGDLERHHGARPLRYPAGGHGEGAHHAQRAPRLPQGREPPRVALRVRRVHARAAHVRGRAQPEGPRRQLHPR